MQTTCNPTRKRTYSQAQACLTPTEITIEFIMEKTGAIYNVAAEALKEAKGDYVKAINALLLAAMTT